MVSTWALFSASMSLAGPVNCEKVPPFEPISKISAEVEALRFHWLLVNGRNEQKEEVICNRTADIGIYDIRGRENDAYYCLRVTPTRCTVVMNGEPSSLVVAPAVWLRQVGTKPMMDYHFHAYMETNSKPGTWSDVYSRVLSEQIEPQRLTLTGTYRRLLENPDNDGYGVQIRLK